MYLDHFGLKEPPFRITPHTDFFFQGANRGATLEALLYAVTHEEGIVKVSGEVGSGKTMLCRVLVERLPASVETIYLANPSLSRDEILFTIADELKLEMDGERTMRVVRALQDHLVRLYAEGRRVVVLIDEAHAMPKETLEEIRLLSNLESNRHKLLQIVLFGQPELEEQLNAAGMRQLRERVTHSFNLEPLVRSDIESYVDFRMRAAGYRGPSVFTPSAIKLVAHASEGLTRRVNILADKALLAAFASGTHAVTTAEVKRAVRDSEFRRSPRGLQKIWIGAGALAAGLALGWGVHALWSEASAVMSEPLSPVIASAYTPGRDGPFPPPHGELTRMRFVATQEWLRSAPGDGYAIQLATANSNELGQLEDFLLKASKVVPAEKLFVYSVKIDGEQYYRAAYGSYAGAAEALAAMNKLPALFTAQRPYYRSIERMRSQNRR